MASQRSKAGYEPINGHVYEFDAYISYADDDYQWVLHHLMPDIDSGELSEEVRFSGEFKLYFKERDETAGSHIISNISDNIEKSKKVIIVLTEKYLSSALHQFEIELAVRLKFERVIEDIIVINVGGVRYKRIPKSLQRKISKDEFLLWENEENAIKVFKERLKNELRRETITREVIV